MAKLLCICGNQLNNIESPNPNTYYIISEPKLDGIAIPTHDAYEKVIELGHQVWKCPKCKRIAIMHKLIPGLTWYMPESLSINVKSNFDFEENG